MILALIKSKPGIGIVNGKALKNMYNFDEIIDRSNTNALNTDGFRGYIFHTDKTMVFPFKDEEFIRMWVADMEFATPDVVIDGIKERLEKRIFGYTKVFSNSYYEAFANWCKRRYDWTFEREHLVMSNGIIPALYELVEYICKPDEKALFLTPSYAYFKYAADFNHRDCVCSDLVNDDGYYTIDFEDLEKKAADDKTTLFILCNPHNPTGRVWHEDELKRLAAVIEKYKLWVISDEIHCDLIRVGQKHIPLGKVMPKYDRLITCMAPSKTFNMAGLMISNVIIRNDELREHWLNRHYNFDNPLSIAAAQAAYEKGEPWLNELQAYLDKNFAFTETYLSDYLPKTRLRIPEATYLAWVNLSEYFEPDEHLPLFFAYKAGVLLEGGNMFVRNSDCFIRLNLACPKTTLEEGLKRICDAVNTQHTEKYLANI
jgi:cystathionine beta-lyase